MTKGLSNTGLLTNANVSASADTSPQPRLKSVKKLMMSRIATCVATEATAIAMAETSVADQHDQPVAFRHADGDHRGREARRHVAEERDRQNHDQAEHENHYSDQYLTDRFRHDRRSAACRFSRAARGTGPTRSTMRFKSARATLLSAIALGSQARCRAAIRFKAMMTIATPQTVGMPGRHRQTARQGENQQREAERPVA